MRSDFLVLHVFTSSVYSFIQICDGLNYMLEQRINLALCETIEEVEMHRVRLVAPGKWMLCASFNLPQVVAFGNPLITVV